MIAELALLFALQAAPADSADGFGPGTTPSARPPVLTAPSPGPSRPVPPPPTPPEVKRKRTERAIAAVALLSLALLTAVSVRHGFLVRRPG